VTGKANPRSVPDLTREEKRRRNAALEQAGRIRAYLPKLRAREEALRHELTELTTLIADELRAFEDLTFEFDSTPEQVARRDRERAA
jgi:hypothetical protein